MNLTSSESAIRALVVSDDPLTIKQISEPLRELAATTKCVPMFQAPFAS